jgi:hypothetical protein
MYFLRRAHELYKSRPEKSLSPSFWESEGLAETDHEGFDAVTSSIEHPLGVKLCSVLRPFLILTTKLRSFVVYYRRSGRCRAFVPWAASVFLSAVTAFLYDERR